MCARQTPTLDVHIWREYFGFKIKEKMSLNLQESRTFTKDELLEIGIPDWLESILREKLVSIAHAYTYSPQKRIFKTLVNGF